MRKNKGEQGYLKWFKCTQALICAVLLAFIIGVVLFGYVRYGSVKNVLTVFAAVASLPFARFASQLFVSLPFKAMEEEKSRQIQKWIPEDTCVECLWELTLSSFEKIYYSPFGMITDQSCILYVENEKDKDEIKKYIEKVFKDARCDVKVSVITELSVLKRQMELLKGTLCEEEELEHNKETLLSLGL